MKISTSGLYHPDSADEIEKYSKKLLNLAEVGDQLPTPIDDIVEVAELVKYNHLNDLDNNWLKKGGSILMKAMKKVLGILDYRKKVIYIDTLIHPSKKRFVTFHEVSHKILPWHEALFNPHLDYEYSIGEKTNSLFEREANYGASLLQFQIDRFSHELVDYEIGLETALYLANQYSTSIHSTFRKYVEDNPDECVLLILNPPENEAGQEIEYLQFWYSVQSPKFTFNFGEKDWNKIIFKGDLIYNIIFSSNYKINEGEIYLQSITGSKVLFKIETFFNNYNYFVLIFKKHRLKLLRKRYIIKSSFSKEV